MLMHIYGAEVVLGALIVEPNRMAWRGSKPLAILKIREIPVSVRCANVSRLRSSNDRFSDLAKDFLPFTFVAKHDSVVQVSGPLSSTWDNNVGGSRAVLLYLQEIIALTKQYLGSPQWEIKQTTSRAIADAVLSCGKEVSQTNADILWSVLKDALGGKTWEGKEKVLDAFVAFVQNAPHFWKNNSNVAIDMQKVNSLPLLYQLLLRLFPFITRFVTVDGMKSYSALTPCRQ